MPIIDELTIRAPDDAHLHLRDDVILDAVLTSSAKNMARAIIMPNTVPPILTLKDALNYKQSILRALKRSKLDERAQTFEPLMTIYLTQDTLAEDLIEGFLIGAVKAAKLYPAGATTNSDAGVKDIQAIYPVLEVMQSIGMPLLVHGEVVDDDIDIFDREAVFIGKVLLPISRQFPALKIVLEHITTEQGVDFIKSTSDNVAASITPHHLVINRNHMLVGGIKPHYYCLPVAKRERHRLALVAAATSGNDNFFLGTDSAPHDVSKKESACGCAGVFNVPVCLSILAKVFEEKKALHLLEAFTSENAAKFYSLSPNKHFITLEKHTEPVIFPDVVQYPGGNIKVFDPLCDLYWSASESSAK